MNPFDVLARSLRLSLDDFGASLWSDIEYRFKFIQSRVAEGSIPALEIEFAVTSDPSKTVIVEARRSTIERLANDPQEHASDYWDPERPGRFVLTIITFIKEDLRAHEIDPPSRIVFDG